MSEPSSNGVDVDARSEQMRGCRMPDDMRTYGLLRDRRHLGCGASCVSFDESVDTGAGEGFSVAVEKHGLGG